MESAKEKAIREAWVKLIGEEEFKTMSVDEHGFSKSSYLRLIPDSEYRDSVIQSTLIKGKMHYRPKSLQGVDNNNGWTRIESEADLPNNNTDVWVITNLGQMLEETFMISHDKYYATEQKRYWLTRYTHWQLKIKPQPPIY